MTFWRFEVVMDMNDRFELKFGCVGWLLGVERGGEVGVGEIFRFQT